MNQPRGSAGLLMGRMLLAETAVLVHLKTIRVVLFILDGVVIALFALAASQRHLNPLI